MPCDAMQIAERVDPINTMPQDLANILDGISHADATLDVVDPDDESQKGDGIYSGTISISVASPDPTAPKSINGTYEAKCVGGQIVGKIKYDFTDPRAPEEPYGDPE